jgi:hypothetical protein
MANEDFTSLCEAEEAAHKRMIEELQRTPFRSEDAREAVRAYQAVHDSLMDALDIDVRPLSSR